MEMQVALPVTFTGFTILLMAVLPMVQSDNYRVYVNSSGVETPLNHFWKSTGFCPPQPHQEDPTWMLSQDMTHNLAFIGALPLRGIEQVRIHWLLDLVKISSLEAGTPVYNFTYLDQLLGNLWQNGLKPGFEIMGNPSGFFTDLENKTQAYLWKDLVQKIAARYVGQFGTAYVLGWNFETWNEPEGRDFDKMKFTQQGFKNYFDACYEGLKAVHKDLRFGIPGGNCKIDDKTGLDYTLLDHVANGRSMFTGRAVHVDYISCHRKGEEPDNTAAILQKEQQVFDDIHSTFPAFKKTPLFNDEADPLVGWNRDRWWRADTTYAAMVAKVIAQHQLITMKKYNYQLLSNDNGFLSYNPYIFTQRTLLARFQINTTQPHYVQFIRKPVYSVMALLSLLKENVIPVMIIDDEGEVLGPTSDFGVLGTVHFPNDTTSYYDWELSILLYNSKDTHNVTGKSHVTVYLDGRVPEVLVNGMAAARYQLDNMNGNPYALWRAKGSPKTPDDALFRAMRAAEGPKRMVGPAEYRTIMPKLLSFDLPQPGVSLIRLCAMTKSAPTQANSLTFYKITKNQVLIVWSDSCVLGNCIKTYEVEYSVSKGASFVRINAEDTFFTSYTYAPPSGGVSGFYRVRPVDYWDRPGDYSLVVQYKED